MYDLFYANKRVEKMLQEAKEFVSIFDEIISNINEEEINSYREKISNISK